MAPNQSAGYILREAGCEARLAQHSKRLAEIARPF
jgi:hypothetical protein